jgi:hypothetical protein
LRIGILGIVAIVIGIPRRRSHFLAVFISITFVFFFFRGEI